MKYSALIVWLISVGCREYYEPPVLKNNPRLLVVDGLLTSSPDTTYFKLTYTRNLRDTAPAVPALHAILMWRGIRIPFYHFLNKAMVFMEICCPLKKTSEKYRLSITTFRRNEIPV
ncbi:MAG: hypothetical protein WDM78_20115 [Puia sp.]